MEPGAEHERLRVIAVSDEESNAISSGDAEGYFAILAADAVFMPPNIRPKAGAVLRQWLIEFLHEVRIEVLSSEHGQTVAADDFAWHEYSCSWKVTPRAGGQAQTTHFKGLHILNRLPDGSWKLSRNIWNLNPAG